MVFRIYSTYYYSILLHFYSRAKQTQIFTPGSGCGDFPAVVAARSSPHGFWLLLLRGPLLSLSSPAGHMDLGYFGCGAVIFKINQNCSFTKYHFLSHIKSFMSFISYLDTPEILLEPNIAVKVLVFRVFAIFGIFLLPERLYS